MNTILQCSQYAIMTYIGIGQGRLTNNLNGAPVDYAMMVSDDESVSMVCVCIYNWLYY